MAGRSIELDAVTWRSWHDQFHGRDDKVRWASVFAEDENPGVGIVELEPGGVLPCHHHAPPEIYHVISGGGEVEIAGEVHALRPGTTAAVPPDAWHETRNTGDTKLRILYFFPGHRFEDVVYHFE